VPRRAANPVVAIDAHRGVSTVATARAQARVEMDASARRRVAEGVVATEQASTRLEGRAAELLHAALRAGSLAGGEPSPVTTSTPQPALGARVTGPFQRNELQPSSAAGNGGPPAPSVAEERVDRAMALVERIDRFVRSGRPALALTLRGGLPGRLELQRVGPGVISLRLSSPRPPAPSELGELRQALEARGLSVRSLESRLLTASAGDACSPCP